MMLAGFAGATGGYDLEEVQNIDPVELQIEVDYCLRLKGFCVLDAGVQDSVLEEALSDLDNLHDQPLRWIPTPPEVLEGILGSQGTGEFSELSFVGAARYTDGEGVRQLQERLNFFTDVSRTHCAEAGFQSVVPSLTLGIRGGPPDQHHDLTEDTCMSWLSTFKLAKLMLVVFLGPDEGVLEITPYDNDSGTIEIKTQPGMLVILRYDALKASHVSTRGNYAMVRWIWAREKTGPRGWRTLALGLQRKMPALQDLFLWAQNRMQHVLNLEDEYGMEQSMTPSREWELMMRHHFFKKDRIPAAVRGASCHIPGPWDPETYWKTVNNGCDYLIEVPYLRWDHDRYYDPDPTCWMRASTATHTHNMGRTSIRHGSFMDGVEMFDNKFFGLSPAESKGMDPQQRHILETTYECMFQAGFKKKDMMNAEIAVYIGTTNPEVNYVDMEVGACSGTGTAVAITSNRISFQLGMMGPSSSVECGMASASMAILVGVKAIIPHHEHRLNTGGLSIAADVGGVFLSITPFTWPRFNWQMNPVGRCLTFDNNADGYVRGEGVGNLALQPYAEKLDGQWTTTEKYCLGSIVGTHCISNGRSASLTAPHGPVIAECLGEVCRNAQISPLDLDGLDCHGIGGLLEDSVEITATTGVLRGMKGGDAEVLSVSSSKTYLGTLQEACGAVAMLKVIYNILYGTQAPIVHLRQLNPHIEIEDEAVLFHTEGISYRDRTSFHASMSMGATCGMNAALAAWYMVDELKVQRDTKELEREVFSFWPAGGGTLDSEALPRQGYYILGSWSRWEEPEEMVQDAPGSFTYTVTLGPNRFESFQILLDGEGERTLHPGTSWGLPGGLVHGPADSSVVSGNAWVIDGRSTVYPYKLQNPEGRIGDCYKVHLLASGKYRTVTWQRLPRDGGAEEIPVTDPGIYYVALNWGARQTTMELAPSEEVLGLHTGTLQLPLGCDKCEFVIVRDKDWGQTFFPAQDSEEVLGPDEGGEGSWALRGRSGERFYIEFQRTFHGNDEARALSWRTL